MRRKHEIITFKVDEDLSRLIKDLPNRSEFIRRAILSALQSVCPLCNGTGILSPSQKRHWADFAENHFIERCQHCGERILICQMGSA